MKSPKKQKSPKFKAGDYLQFSEGHPGFNNTKIVRIVNNQYELFETVNNTSWMDIISLVDSFCELDLDKMASLSFNKDLKELLE